LADGPPPLAQASEAAGERGYLHLQAPKFARQGRETVCRIHWAVGGKPVSGIVRVQAKTDGEWVDEKTVRVTKGRGTWRPDVEETAVYRVVPVSATDYPDAVTPASAARKIAARQAKSKVSAPILSASTYFTSEGNKVTFTAKWLYQGRRVTGKVKLQANTSGTSWKTVAKGVTTKGKATFKVKVSESTKYRVVGTATSSHRGRIKVGALYGSSPVVAVAAKPKSGGLPADSFRITGSGYGHGVGMSQYGAQAMALAGKSAKDILTHYYTGTEVVTKTIDKVVRIQIGTTSSAPAITFSGGGGTISVDGAEIATPQAGDKVRLSPAGAGVQVARVGADGGETPLGSGSRVSLRTDGVMSVTGARGTYKRGTLEASLIGNKVNVVNRVALDTAYLYGLAEVPSSWAPAALEAQAIAARNYAVVNSGSVKGDCDCHLYDDTRSQVYNGWAKENEATYGANWKAAVDATAGQIVVDSGGEPISAYYSSSSGGRTENSEDVWSSALPYLRSVADPWSLDPAARNPNITWSKTLSGAAVARAFDLPDVASLRVAGRTAGGNARVLEATSSSGTTKSISRAEEIRRVLELKSAHITGIEAG
jgi:SpoIID/LytB domain protein